MSKAKLVKDLLKTKKESVMGKLGDSPYDDPMEPWSAKYNAPVKNEEVEQLEEDSWLFSYIKSLGYNPKIMSFAQRAKYARSNAFKHYKQSHMEKDTVPQATTEATDMCNVCGQTPCNCTHLNEISDKKLQDYRYQAHSQIQHYKHAGGKDKPEASKVLAKREPGMARATAKVIQKQKERIAAQPKKEPGKMEPYKPLGGYDPVSNRSYSESVESLDEAGTGLLMTYIKAKGLNPLTMDGNQKHAYARSSEFKIFKQKHANVKKEEFERLLKAYGAENLVELVMQIQETSGMGERGDDWNEETGGGDQIKSKKKKIKEEADKADTVTMDIPLLIRVLEYAREDAKTDMDLHKVVENLINMRKQGTLSMDLYNKIVAIKEDIESLDEISKDLARGYMLSAFTDRKNRDEKIVKTSEKNRKQFSNVRHKNIMKMLKKNEKRSQGVARAIDRLQKEEAEQLDELKASTYGSYIDKVTDPKVASTRGKTQTGTLKSIKAIGGVAKAIGKRAKAQSKELNELKKQDDNMEIDDRITREEKKMKGSDPCWKGYQMVGTKKKGGREVPNCVPEETQIQEGLGNVEDSPMSATNSVKAMESSHRAKQMKSARMIKSLYKNKIKETMYDWEKDDKPNAKIVVKGGTTMTGQPRDVVEIEPVLRTRPNQQKPTV